MNVYLNGLATQVPGNLLPQDLVENNARRILGPKFKAFEKMAPSFKSSGVEKRYSFAPIDWFDHPRDWEDRNSIYLSEGKAIFIKAARKALKAAGLNPDEVDTIVTVSSTGIATPTLEALAFEEMGFRADVRRIPVFGLGCAGGVTGLSISQSLAIAHPGTNVLLVVIEACTLSFRSDRLRKADIIATVLFGDGAAAAVLSTQCNGASQVSISSGSEHLWPETLSIMGWNVDNTGLGVVFDRSIPAFANAHMAEAVKNACEKAKLCQQTMARYVFHPGGTKVVEALEQTLELQTGTLDAERETLRDYGNMSAPTALFVLENVLSKGIKGDMLLGALGPGFTASFVPAYVS